MKSAKKKTKVSVESSKATPRKQASKPPKRAPAAKRPAASKPKPRADYGAPIDGFFEKQPPHLRAILEVLRELVNEVVPDAESAIKWGQPFYTIDGRMMCALGGHRSHVNLVLAGPPSAFVDPEGLLTGEAKTGRHLKLTSLEQLPRAAVRGWLKTAAKIARGE